jgi:hypothetical protein
MVEIKSLRMGAGRIEPIVAAVLDAYERPGLRRQLQPAGAAVVPAHRPEVPRVLTAGSLHGWPLPSSVRRRLSDLKDARAGAAGGRQLRARPGCPPRSPTPGGRRRGAGDLDRAQRRQLTRAASLADNVIFERVRP